VTKIFSKAMVDSKLKSGSIVNISSIVGKAGNYGQANYAASKSGVIGLTKTAARELAQYNIRCNAVLPGYIRTDLTKLVKPKLVEAVRSQIPMKRFGEPQEIAQACLYLASDMSTYVTGATLEVTGGLLM
jgi:NAD(P)-dependent dehydrogenase (short-subunit alcohol dehydrogenase family)